MSDYNSLEWYAEEKKEKEIYKEKETREGYKKRHQKTPRFGDEEFLGVDSISYSLRSFWL